MIIEFRSISTDGVIYAVDQVRCITAMNPTSITYVGYAHKLAIIPINSGEYIVVRSN